MKRVLKNLTSIFWSGFWPVFTLGILGWILALIIKEIFKIGASIAYLFPGLIFLPGFQFIAFFILVFLLGLVFRETNLLNFVKKKIVVGKFGIYQAGLFVKEDGITWEIGAIVKVITPKSIQGEPILPSELIVGSLFSSPFFWSSFPPTFVTKAGLIPLSLSLAELMPIVSSFGTQTPEELKYYSQYSTDQLWIKREKKKIIKENQSAD